MNKRQIGNLSVQPIGLGCMNLDHAYGPSVSEEQGERVLLGALDAGYDFLDTATLYGGGKNEERIGRVLKKHRHRFTLASKCVMAIVPVDGKPTRVIDGRPETIKRQCEDSLRRLQTDVIDLYYLHRWDKKVPIEDSVGALSDMVRKGHIRAIGLSEVGAVNLRKAHAVHPIAAMQSEYSLWTRDPEIAVLQACKELGVGFVAFSSVARKFFGGLKDASTLHEKDIRLSMARFSKENLPKNLTLLAPMEQLAGELNCTVAQLALAWVLAQGDHICSIPGTTDVQHMKDNLASQNIVLTAAHLTLLGEAINQRTVHGARYDAQSQSEVDTESFA
ncbi:MAG: aldo/keto reductase [Brachymonas sp.]|nr:aldo/keto reductase [Brachymonas sp.]